PVPTPPISMAGIETKCRGREANLAFLKCKKKKKKNDPNLDKGRQVTRCVL
ncbi:hypothetical protein M569_03510, partial [Genlisea aurea]